MNISENQALQKLNKAKIALSEARTIDEAKTVRNQAEAMAIYVKRQQYSQECLKYCIEMRVRAERRIGELLPEIITPHRVTQKPGGPARVLLADLGISTTQSYKWQQLASIPESDFESWVTLLTNEEHLSTTALMQKISDTKRKAVDRSKTIANIILSLATRLIHVQKAVEGIIEVREEWTTACPQEMVTLQKTVKEVGTYLTSLWGTQ